MRHELADSVDLCAPLLTHGVATGPSRGARAVTDLYRHDERMRRGCVLIAICLLALSGCSSAVLTQRAGDTVMMTSASNPRGVQLAILEGTLTRTPQGCLASRTPDGGAVVVQFPHGSILSANGRSVDIPDVGTLHLGDSFSGGGGDGDLVDLRGVPAECQVGTSFISWQSGGAVRP